MKKQALYPVIAKEYNDEDGHYFVITSPNIQGMVVEGETLDEAVEEASYDIADWFEAKGKVEEFQDSSIWELTDNEKIVYVPVSLDNFYVKYGQSVRKNISIPEYLADWAKENKINVSRVAADALRSLMNA